MIGLDVEDHRHGGEEGEEGVAVLAALQDDGVPVAHPVAGANRGRVPPIITVGSIRAAMMMWVHMEVVVVLPWVPAMHRAFL